MKTTLLFFLISWATVQAPLPVERYCNTRYGFCVDYPEDVFPVQHISTNDDGVIAMSDDGNYQLRVYGYFNVMDWSVQDEFSDYLEVLQANHDMEVKQIFSRFDGDQYEAQFEIGSKVIYEKTYKKGEFFISMSLEVNRRNSMTVEKSRDLVADLRDRISLRLD